MLKILIVDDSKSAQFKIHSILSEFGNCDQAYNGREGVDLFSASLDSGAPYDLVVMDIVMPEMDGLAAASEIGRIQDRHKIPEEKKTKVIMLTSKSDPSHMMKAHFEAGVTTYVTKPFEEKTLIEAMTNLGLLKT